MGGPAAWREMQKKQSEWKQGGFDEPVNSNAGDDEDNELDRSQKRDIYAEYDIKSDQEAESKIALKEDDSNVSTSGPADTAVLICPLDLYH